MFVWFLPIKTQAVNSFSGPSTVYLNRFFECDSAGIAWCYAFSTLKDNDGWYKTWFFAPATDDYPNTMECIYMARNKDLDKNWQVYTWDKGWETLPYDSSQAKPENFKPVVCTQTPSGEDAHMVGDPAVVKINNKYYMLYSYNDRDKEYVYGAVSNDGLNWTGKKLMWQGHRPSMIEDDQVLRVWFDIHLPGMSSAQRTIRMKTLALSKLDNFLDPSQWEVASNPTSPLNSANTEVLKIKNKYFAVTDFIKDNRLSIAYTYSDDGNNWEPRKFLVNDQIIPSGDSQNSRGITVPQLFQQGDNYYLIANIMNESSRILNRAYLFQLLIDADDFYSPAGIGAPNSITGYDQMEIDKSYNQVSGLSYKLKSNLSYSGHSYSGTRFFVPQNMRINRVTFDYITNYDNSLLIGALSDADENIIWEEDLYGHQTGQVDISIPMEPHIGLGLFARSDFKYTLSDWKLQIKDLKIYYLNKCHPYGSHSRGDADNNQKINLIDFASWLEQFKSEGFKEEKKLVDFHCEDSGESGFIDLDDFNIWLSSYSSYF